MNVRAITERDRPIIEPGSDSRSVANISKGSFSWSRMGFGVTLGWIGVTYGTELHNNFRPSLTLPINKVMVFILTTYNCFIVFKCFTISDSLHNAHKLHYTLSHESSVSRHSYLLFTCCSRVAHTSNISCSCQWCILTKHTHFGKDIHTSRCDFQLCMSCR